MVVLLRIIGAALCLAGVAWVAGMVAMVDGYSYPPSPRFLNLDRALVTIAGGICAFWMASVLAALHRLADGGRASETQPAAKAPFQDWVEKTDPPRARTRIEPT